MTLPRLYAVLDVEVAASHGWTVLDLARAVLDGGATCLQLRAKSRSLQWTLDVPAGKEVVLTYSARQTW